MKNLYLSGPMTGKADFNRPEFAEAATALRSAGFTVWNPGELSEQLIVPFTWENCMRRNIQSLLFTDAIVQLNGWEESKGARLEHRIAVDLGIDVVPYLVFKAHVEKMAGPLKRDVEVKP